MMYDDDEDYDDNSSCMMMMMLVMKRIAPARLKRGSTAAMAAPCALCPGTDAGKMVRTKNLQKYTGIFAAGSCKKKTQAKRAARKVPAIFFGSFQTCARLVRNRPSYCKKGGFLSEYTGTLPACLGSHQRWPAGVVAASTMRLRPAKRVGSRPTASMVVPWLMRSAPAWYRRSRRCCCEQPR